MPFVIDELTLLVLGAGTILLGSTVLDPMAKRAERLEAMEAFDKSLNELGLGSMVVVDASLADHDEAVALFNERAEAGFDFLNRSDAAIFMSSLNHQLAGGKKMREEAEKHGLQCPECGQHILTAEQAKHGLEHMLGTKIG